MANFTAGTSFSDGVTNDVTAAKLNALVADAVPTSNLSLNSTTGTIGLFSSGTGTAATPAIQPTGDTNTGIFFPAADTIAFSEGGAEAMRIDSSGNVGVGTTSPAYALQVKSGGASGTLSLSGGSEATGGPSYILMGNNNAGGATGPCVITSSNRDLVFGVGSSFTASAGGTFTERLRIDSSGNVGVGTASPVHALQVKSGSGSGTLSLSGGSEATGGASYILMGNNDAGGSTGPCVISSSNRDLVFGVGSSFTASNGGTFTERLRIDSSGGVTIAGLAGSGSRAVNASAAGLLSAASDASLKEEVVGASIAGLNEILQIHPKMYRWKDDIANRGDEASVELGFIANDVAPIIPSAAPMGNDGLYGFYDRSITAALVKAVQELSAKVTALEAA